MAWKYNPFTDALDLTGSGGTSYIDGDVEYHSNLPVTVGTPAVNSAFLVRKGEGLYFISRKPAGIWVRELNNGNLDDWKYAGTFSDLYRDANFRIINDADTSKEIAFSAASIGTGQTRVITVPNKNITLDDAGDARTPTSHTHGNLTNDGKIGTTSGLPLKTGTAGVVEAGSFGTSAGTFCEGNDARLSDARTPSSTLAHAASHATAGSDPVSLDSYNQIQLAVQDAPADFLADVGLNSDSNVTFRELNLREDVNGYLAKFDAQSITGNRTLTIPNASGTLALQGAITTSGLTQATARLIGRTSSGTGAPEELSASDVRSFLNVADGATAYTHPNHTGDVTSVGDGATTIANNAVTYAKMQDISATSRILGRKTAAAGDTEECTLSEILDFVGSAAQGDILYRGASTWTRLAAGTNGHYLQTKGSGANPEWAAVAGGGATNLWIPASAWIPRTTSGCGVDSREIGSTNRQNFDELLFDTGSEEFAQALVVMPSNYNNLTLTARFYWTASSGSGGVAWGISGRAFGDDDAIDQATGTRIVVTDTLLAANDVHVTAATSAVTIDGTPAANKAINFQISRVVADNADTLAVDARFLGAEIIFN